MKGTQLDCTMISVGDSLSHEAAAAHFASESEREDRMFTEAEQMRLLQSVCLRLQCTAVRVERRRERERKRERLLSANYSVCVCLNERQASRASRFKREWRERELSGERQQ